MFGVVIIGQGWLQNMLVFSCLSFFYHFIFHSRTISLLSVLRHYKVLLLFNIHHEPQSANQDDISN